MTAYMYNVMYSKYMCICKAPIRGYEEMKFILITPSNGRIIVNDEWEKCVREHNFRGRGADSSIILKLTVSSRK
jgi:hypothetical protein